MENTLNIKVQNNITVYYLDFLLPHAFYFLIGAHFRKSEPPKRCFAVTVICVCTLSKVQQENY